MTTSSIFSWAKDVELAIINIGKLAKKTVRAVRLLRNLWLTFILKKWLKILNEIIVKVLLYRDVAYCHGAI
jgi:hypothetical protein